MSKLLYAGLFVICCWAAGCSKAQQDPIGEKSDQALIQDIVVSDSVQNELSVTKVVPKIITDPKTNVEKPEHADVPLQITVTLKPGADIKRLNVRFTLSSQSKYAKVSPSLGRLEDFTAPRTYTVTSQSGRTVNVYSLVVKMP